MVSEGKDLALAGNEKDRVSQSDGSKFMDRKCHLVGDYTGSL